MKREKRYVGQKLEETEEDVVLGCNQAVFLGSGETASGVGRGKTQEAEDDERSLLLEEAGDAYR